MSYYHLPTNTERGPKRLETKLSDGKRLGPDPDEGWTLAQLVDCGFAVVVNTSQPADTSTTVYDRSIVVTNGVPTETWTARTKSAAQQASELASATASANGVTLRDRATTALTDNATFLAIGTLTNAQVVAQVRSLTRQVNALARLSMNSLSEIADS